MNALAAAHPGFLSPTGVEIVFILVGLGTLAAALVTVSTRQLVHAALWLVATLGGVAVEYLLLTAEFIAWVQVLIYVGAVVVLLLFAVMLTRAPIGASGDLNRPGWPGLLVGAGAGLGLAALFVDAYRWTSVSLPTGAGGPGSAEVVGGEIFASWVLPFEVLSVLLLAALVGAIIVSRPDVGASDVEAPDRGAER
ncbi:MAG: NADH-quinone oxidoreductase subunit J family protein [Thermocrispum sp.]